MALIPRFFINTVVAVGVAKEDAEPTWVASAFFYGRYVKKTEKGKQYRVYLVSNRHVFEGLANAVIRCNPKANEPAKVYNLPLTDKGEPVMFVHPDPDVDIAVIPLNIGALKDEGMDLDYFCSDTHVATRERMKDLEVSEGDAGFVLGFPMRMVGGRRNVVLVRSACLARVQDAIDGANKEFLIDSAIFPGNSGGPVILRPESLSITGTSGLDAAYLVGVVAGYVTFHDVAVSEQTGRTRVIFEENSGLAAAHPVDYIDDTIQLHWNAEGIAGEEIEAGEGVSRVEPSEEDEDSSGDGPPHNEP